MIFAVRPPLDARSTGRAVLLGALFGLFAYGTYDLTNLAVLRDWLLRLAFIDLAWGTFASAVSAGAGAALTRWWAGR